MEETVLRGAVLNGAGLTSVTLTDADLENAILTGARVEELVPILGSLFFVIGDIDK